MSTEWNSFVLGFALALTLLRNATPGSLLTRVRRNLTKTL